MSSKFDSFFEFSHMDTRESIQDIPEAYPDSLNLSATTLYPLANATEIIELDPEDLILPVADDPIDFIIELGNETDDLQYIAEKTNELYGTTEEDINTIINELIEAITEWMSTDIQ